VRLADPRRADEHHVLRLLEEAERPQVHDPRPVDGRLVREVEVVNDVIIITIYDDLKTANCGKN
jgi:ribosome-binding factor A